MQNYINFLAVYIINFLISSLVITFITVFLSRELTMGEHSSFSWMILSAISATILTLFYLAAENSGD